MGIDIPPQDMERSHRIGQSRQPGEKAHPIIDKFVPYNDRNKIFRSKKNLKIKKFRQPKVLQRQNTKIERSMGATWFLQCLDKRW